MEVKKYDKIILDSSRSIDDIVAGIKAELSKQESKNAGENYICYVSHAYSSGDNAGANYIVVSDGFKELKRLSSNVIKARSYSKDEINELIATNISTKANANSVVNLTDEQTIEGVKTFSSVPVVATQPTNDNQVVNKAYVDSKSSELNSRIDSVNSNLTNSVNTKANQATTYTKTEVDDRMNVKANQSTTYTKTEVDDRMNVKANWNAVVTLTGNETIFGDKAFVSPVIVPDATVSNHAVNLSQLDNRINGRATWDYSYPRVETYNKIEVNNLLNAKADINYVKKRGGFVIVNGGYFNLDNGINFQLNLSRANMIGVTVAERNIGQTGEIFIPNGNFISGFASPFNFRVAQSGFGANEVFSYLVVSANLVRITRS